MKYELIIRDITDKSDIRANHNVSEERFEYVKSQFEKELARFNENHKKQYGFLGRTPYVLLINKLDDNGEFLEIVQ